MLLLSMPGGRRPLDGENMVPRSLSMEPVSLLTLPMLVERPDGFAKADADTEPTDWRDGGPLDAALPLEPLLMDADDEGAGGLGGGLSGSMWALARDAEDIVDDRVTPVAPGA